MFQKRFSFAALAGAAAASFILATAMQSHPPLSQATAVNAAGFEARLPSFAAIAKRTMPVVVNIATTAQWSVRGGSSDPIDEFFNHFFGEMQPRENSQRSLGSGIIINREGEILTSYHVVKDADAIKVRLADHSEYDAWLVGKDDKTDLALIKIRKANMNLPFARLGSSSQLNVGDWVMAIGNPFGLEHTVTAGIVSAKGRVIGAGPYDNFIQTDASINPGNSGGPLINAIGEVVGINSAIFSQNGGNVGIGFAIPVDLAKKVVNQLRKNGRVVRGWLGIRVRDAAPRSTALPGHHRNGGERALVTDVAEHSPAADAGITPGDVIVEYNGKPLPKHDDFRSMIADTPPGQKVTLKIFRGKLERLVSLTIGELPDDGTSGLLAEVRDPEVGLRVQRITPDTARRLGLGSTKGVLVVEVQPNSPADQVGIEPADVIREVNQRPVNSVKDFARSMRQGRRGDRILLLVQRGDNAVFFALRRKS
jgi:serine protease Do